MLRIKNIFNAFPLPILLISLLFFIKALYLAFCVIPFSAVPDEIGHFAYVQDIAYGKGIPVLSAPTTGKSVIGKDIMGYIEKTTNTQPAYNWIAQHPPVYYILAAIPLKFGSLLTNDRDILFRLPRIISALSGALLLLVLFKTLTIVGLDPSRSTAIAAAVGFIPMVTHLSSGTNHDIPLFLFCALATYYFAHFIIHQKIGSAYWCAIWLAIAGGTKMMTPWVLLIPMVTILILELSGADRIKHAVGITLVSLSIPIAWMLRNFAYFGNPLYTSGTDRKPGLDAALNIRFSDFIHLQPVFDQTINWFYGMFVYLGAGSGKLFLEYDVSPRHLNFAWFAVKDFPYNAFLVILFSISCICVLYILILIWKIFNEGLKQPENNSLISWGNSKLINHGYKSSLFSCTILVALFSASFIGFTSFTNLKFILFSSIPISIFLGVVAIPLIFGVTEKIDRIALYGFVITLFFGILLIYHLYGAYLVEGELRATQGRYFYPIIPLALLSAAIALMRLRVPGIIINAIVALLACMELSVYLQQVIPFYLKQYS